MFSRSLAPLSLAPIRYRDVLAPTGPIAQCLRTAVSVEGRPMFQVNAWLKPGLRPVRQGSLYSDADGTGTHPSPVTATHIAISEALERWAFDDTWRWGDHATYGFDQEPSSTGMAAFPGLTTGAARQAALHEAIERATVQAWWAGLTGSRRCSTEWPGVEGVELETRTGAFCVVLFRTLGNGDRAYGHAAAPSFTTACEKALIELSRNQRVLEHARRVEQPVPSELTGHHGCLTFGSASAHAALERRIGAAPVGVWHPRVLVDREIRGEWTRYATVWRVLLHPPVSALPPWCQVAA